LTGRLTGADALQLADQVHGHAGRSGIGQKPTASVLDIARLRAQAPNPRTGNAPDLDHGDDISPFNTDPQTWAFRVLRAPSELW
jgi:hypothetical protein